MPNSKFPADTQNLEEIYKKNQELLEQRRRSEQLLYGVPEAVFAVNENYEITLFNNSIETMIEVKAKEVLNKTLNSVVILQDENGKQIPLDRYCFVKQKDFKPLEEIILKGKDKNYYVNVESSTITLTNGKKECLITLTNVTKQTRKDLTEEIYKKNLELLEQRRRSERLLYSVSEAVFAVNKNHEITLFNNAAEIMVGVKAKEALNKNIDLVINLHDDKENTITSDQYCFVQLENFKPLEGAILKGKSQNYYVNAKSSVISLADGKEECLVTLTDVTKEKELEKTKNDFISVTSHELRTPMTIIKSYLWMLEKERGGPPLTTKQKEYVERATNGATRMLNLINDTLNISRIEQGRIEFKIEEFNVSDEMKELENDFKVKTDEKHIYYAYNAPVDLHKVLADRSKIREVLINLVGNSIKFTNDGGIAVKAENLNQQFVQISIIDTGKGIGSDDMNKLFHKFGRLDNNYQTVAESGGTGLGLYIVKSLIENMGGKVGASSSGVGKGSTFWFTLPTSQKST